LPPTFDPRESNMPPSQELSGAEPSGLPEHLASKAPIIEDRGAPSVDDDVLSAQLAPETRHSSQDTYDPEAIQMRYEEYQSRRELEELFESGELSCHVI
jgi:hypothetical protein